MTRRPLWGSVQTMTSEAGSQLLRFIKAGALTGGLRAAGMASMLVFVACMSSWMEAGDFGALALIISMATLAAGFGGFGQAEMNIRAIAARRAAGEEDATVEVPNASVGLILWVSTAIGALLSLYLVIDGYPPSLWISMLVLTVSLSLMTGLAGAARAADRFVLALLPKDIAWRLIAIALVGGLVLVGQGAGIEVVAPILALSALVCALWQAKALRIRAASMRRPHPQVLAKGYVLGSAAIALSLFALVALSTLDVIVVGAMISPEAAAAYFPATRLAILAAFAGLPIQLVVEPRVADMLARSDMGEAQRLTNAATILQSISSLVLGLALILGFPFYAALFPTAGAQTFEVLVILVAGCVIGSLCGMSGPILMMAGHQRILAQVNLLCACFAAGLLVFAASRGDLIAVALVVTGLEVLRKFVTVGYAYHRTGLLPFSLRRL